MTKPKILTSGFWTPRVDALTDNIGRAIRSGLQMLAAAFFAGTTNVLTFDWKVGGAAFLSGVVLSFLTTFAKPPTPPGGDPAVDTAPAVPKDAGYSTLMIILIVLAIIALAIWIYQNVAVDKNALASVKWGSIAAAIGVLK